MMKIENNKPKSSNTEGSAFNFLKEEIFCYTARYVVELEKIQKELEFNEFT